MSIHSIINKEIKDMRFTLNNDLVIQYIVHALAKKIKHSPVVKLEYKKEIEKYLGPDLTKKQCISKILTEDNDFKNLLIATVIYYLSDLNIYDFYLVNYAFNYGMQIENVIVLLLLNNIFDIEIFCKKSGLHGEIHYNILTLKKLSALHKVQYNFG